MAVFIDLIHQIQKVLPTRYGGTGNADGITRGTVLFYSNDTGGSLALGTVVKLSATYDDSRVIATTAAADTGVIGVVVGRVITTGETAGEWEAVAPADHDGVAVMVAGRCTVLIDAAVTRGEFASSSATAGKAQGDATPQAGTFGQFETAGTTSATVRVFAASGTGGGGAPTGADYLVGTAQAGLSAEIVVGTSPGGELGGTWASPTVDTVHSGSAHSTPSSTDYLALLHIGVR